MCHQYAGSSHLATYQQRSYQKQDSNKASSVASSSIDLEYVIVVVVVVVVVFGLYVVVHQCEHTALYFPADNFLRVLHFAFGQLHSVML
jgi:hypothetical protein